MITAIEEAKIGRWMKKFTMDQSPADAVMADGSGSSLREDRGEEWIRVRGDFAALGDQGDGRRAVSTLKPRRDGRERRLEFRRLDMVGPHDRADEGVAQQACERFAIVGLRHGMSFSEKA
jgi:hypothetical protein